MNGIVNCKLQVNNRSTLMRDLEKRKSGCPVAWSLDLLGDKWTLLIVRDALVRDFCTFRQFLDAGEGIATNILADRLKRLVDAGILRRERDPDNRRSYLYLPTQMGRELAPVIRELMRWGARHDPCTLATPELMQAIGQKLHQQDS